MVSMKQCLQLVVIFAIGNAAFFIVMSLHIPSVDFSYGLSERPMPSIRKQLSNHVSSELVSEEGKYHFAKSDENKYVESDKASFGNSSRSLSINAFKDCLTSRRDMSLKRDKAKLHLHTRGSSHRSPQKHWRIF